MPISWTSSLSSNSYSDSVLASSYIFFFQPEFLVLKFDNEIYFRTIVFLDDVGIYYEIYYCDSNGIIPY